MYEILIVFAVIFYAKCHGAPSSTQPPKEVVVEVPYGKNAILSCESNDDNHNFLYWELAKHGTIGPGNEYDQVKYDYEVLSGALIIKRVSSDEEGIYKCVSRGVRNDNINIRTVRMIVKRDWEEVYEHNPSVNFFRIVILMGSVFIILGGGYLVYRKWKGQHRLQSILEEDDDEEDSGEEIFSAPGTSKGTGNIILEKSSDRLLDDFDNSLSTEFGGILNQDHK